jgi:hypothetical protein
VNQSRNDNSSGKDGGVEPHALHNVLRAGYAKLKQEGLFVNYSKDGSRNHLDLPCADQPMPSDSASRITNFLYGEHRCIRR